MPGSRRGFFFLTRSQQGQISQQDSCQDACQEFFPGRITPGTLTISVGSWQVPGILVESCQSRCLFHEFCSVWFIQYSAILGQRHLAKCIHQTTSVRSCSDKKLIIVWFSVSFSSMQSFVLMRILETEF